MFFANLEHNFSLSDKLQFKNRHYFKKRYFSPDEQIFLPGVIEYGTEGNLRDINNDGVIDIFSDGMNATYELDDDCTRFEILGYDWLFLWHSTTLCIFPNNIKNLRCNYTSLTLIFKKMK